MALRPPACTQLQRNAFHSQHYMVIAEASLAEVMSDAYWIHVWKQLRANDVITAVAADGSYDVDFRITSIVPTGPNTTPKFTFRLIRVAPIAVPQPMQRPVSAGSSRYEVKHAGFGKWRVIDQMTGNVVCDGVTKDVAEAEKVKLETPVAA